MRIDKHGPDERIVIERYTERQIFINEKPLQGSILVHKNKVTSPWNIATHQALDAGAWQALLALQADIYVIGIPISRDIPNAMIYAPKNFPIEIMPTKAACNVFNLLQIEQRNVIGLLFT